MRVRVGVLVVALGAMSGLVFGETYSLTIPAPGKPTPSSAFRLGTAAGSNGVAVTVDGASLLFGGERVVPVMGEMHYSRTDPADWREELLKMKAGGVTVVSTYVFWNHHEEVEGKWEWTGSRDLRKFLETCKEAGMPVLVRMGPWCHGEVRNGGFPDWVVARKLKLRTEDPGFLKLVGELYGEIARQMKGLMWKDGGPVVGVQVDNEYGGKGSYLMALKKIAVGAGIDVPLYTRTGWPKLREPTPFGELLPMYGAYAEGFWDKELSAMPGSYWQAFTFAAERTDTAVGTDVLGNRAREDEANVQEYPYLTCELGGGMETSYHRRVHVDPKDAWALEIAKVGSGSNMPGFYMYHGGTNPDSLVGGMYLNEQQGAPMTNSNDMPDKSYDFLAPIGQYGQIREPYHLLRRTGMFLHDWAEELAPMKAVIPEGKITKKDATDLRWAVRSDGKSGFVFVNNYERGLEMPAKEGVVFELKLPGDEASATVPHAPMRVPANTAFFMPFNMQVEGIKLPSAVAQPVCQVTDGAKTTMVFAQLPRMPETFTSEGDESSVSVIEAKEIPGGFAQREIRVRGKDHTTDILIVDDETSLRIWRANVGGKERILVTPPGETLYTDGKTVTLQTTDPALTKFDLVSIPPLEGVTIPKMEAAALPKVEVKQTQEAGALREIRMGSRKLATEPTDAEFAGEMPAVWKISFADRMGEGRKILLRVHYVGDVARLYLGDRLLTDNFYNGTAFDLDLTHLGAEVWEKGLTLKIMPLQKGAPVYIQTQDMPEFGGKESVVGVKGVEVVETREVTVGGR